MAKPQPVTLAARFVTWGAVVTSAGPCLTMTVIPEGKPPITVTVPNTQKTSRTVDPPANVKALSGQLRIGDALSVTYQKEGTALVVQSATPSAQEDPAGDAATVFTFGARRTVKYAGKDYQAVTVKRAVMSWTFLLPDADPSDPAYQPDAALVEKLKGFQQGAQVRLTYDVGEYMFWLKDIADAKVEEKPA